VFITDDEIARGPADVLATLLHEVAPGVAERRGVKDSSAEASTTTRGSGCLEHGAGVLLVEERDMLGS
jgi:hypothetical protein